VQHFITCFIRGIHVLCRRHHACRAKLAPEAGYLSTAAFPSLTLEQADQILTDTEGPGEGFLDDGSASGVSLETAHLIEGGNGF
jgi:hypothetical protein